MSPAAVPLVVTGTGAVSAAGLGTAATAGAIATGTAHPADVSALHDEPLPYQKAFALTDFDVRALLGRKGTTFLDRGTSLALVACREALAGGIAVDGADGRLGRDAPVSARVGVVLGTTVGSMRSSTDYSRETLVNDRPYLVNPALFPNTVLNGAAGQAAIRYGLRGVNATVATGRLGFSGAVRYAANVLQRDYAGAMVVGAFEELTPATAWAHHRQDRPGLPGEGAGVIVLERADFARQAGRPSLATVLGAVEGYHPDGREGYPARLGAAVRTALQRAGLAAADVEFVAASEGWDAEDEQIGTGALELAGLAGAHRVTVRDTLGDCAAATGALQLVAALAAPGAGALAGPGLLLAWSPSGAYGIVVLGSGRDAGADRRLG